MERLQRQIEGRNKWEQNNFNGIKVYATGVGKSFFATYKANDIAGDIEYLLSKHPVRTLIITDGTNNKAQWLNNISKYLPNRINLLTVETISKLVASPESFNFDEYKFVIADEVDAYTSELRRVFINRSKIKWDYFLGLTATIFLIDIYYPEFYNISPVIDKITLKEAEVEGYVAKSNEYNIALELPKEDKVLYDKYTKIIGDAFHKLSSLYQYIPYMGTIGDSTQEKLKILYNSVSIENFKSESAILLNKIRNSYNDFYKFRLILTAVTKGMTTYRKGGNKEFVTNKEWINKLAVMNGFRDDLDTSSPFEAPIYREWHPKTLTTFVNQVANAFEERFNLLRNHKDKIRMTRKIIESFKYPKTIVFSESSAFANKLHKYLNICNKKEVAVLYHSNATIPSKDKSGNIRRWKTGERLNKIIYLGTTSRKVDKDNPSGISALMAYNLNRLKSDKSDILCAVKGLGRGFNYEDLSLVITTSYTDSQTEYYQNKGRGIRISDNNLQATIVNVYFKDTVEFWKLKSRQQDAIANGTNIYWVDDIQDLTKTESELGIINI